MPVAMRISAHTVRPVRSRATDGAGSTAAPVAAIGETPATRRVPTQAESHVVSVTITTAASASGSNRG